MSLFASKGGIRWYFNSRHFWDNWWSEGKCMLCNLTEEEACNIIASWGEMLRQEVGITPEQVVEAERKRYREPHALYINEAGKLQIRGCMFARTFVGLVGDIAGEHY